MPVNQIIKSLQILMIGGFAITVFVAVLIAPRNIRNASEAPADSHLVYVKAK